MNVFCGDHVLSYVPEVGRGNIMEMLHDGHPGMTRMKAIARGIVW